MAYYSNYNARGAREASYKILVEPTDEPISSDMFAAHSRMNASAENQSLLSQYLGAARVDVEQAINRALMPQTWVLSLSDFPYGGEIRLPMPPLQSVTSIVYTSSADVVATLPTTEYEVDLSSTLGRVVLKYGKYWPATVLRALNGIQITFVAGYSSADAVPMPLKQAILLQAANLYENRESVLVGDSKKASVANPLAFGLVNLLTKYQVNYY